MKTAKKIRVGVVGTGFAGSFHVDSWRRVYDYDVELAGVTSLHAESRKAFGSKHGIAVYESVEAMLDHIDILDVCSPPYVHEEGILAAAMAGKGVVCEKPLTGCFGPKDADDNFCGIVNNKNT